MKEIPAPLGQQFAQGASPKTDFVSTDWRTVWDSSRQSLNHALNRISGDAKPSVFFGMSKDELMPVYDRAKALSLQNDRLWDVRQGLQDLSFEQLAAIAQIETVRGQAWTGAHFMADRNRQNQYYGSETFDRNGRREKMVQKIRLKLALGYTPQQIAEHESDKKKWPTGTAHPTKDKSKLGQKLSSRQVEIADHVLREDREEAMIGLFAQMLTTRITPERKDKPEDETLDGIEAQGTYNEGMLDYLEDLQGAFDEVLGPGVIDMIGPDMHIDLAMRKWHGGGDVDGNDIPATVVFNHRVLDALTAVKHNLATLRNPALESKHGYEQLLPVAAVFESFEKGLTALNSQAEWICNKATEEEFEQIKTDFSNVFRSTSYKGQLFNRGPHLTSAVMQDMNILAHDVNIDQAIRSAAFRTVGRHKQNGIAMGKTEVRHNGKNDYTQIFDNFYALLQEKNLGIEGVKKLSQLDADGQAAYFNRLMREHRGEIQGLLFEAHPPSDDSKKQWLREVLNRWSLLGKCFNHNRMGAAIIAESTPLSPVQQQVLAEAFGIEKVIHVALNEELETIMDAPENLMRYVKYFGRDNLEKRAGNGQDTNYFFCVMDPQSDSQKGNGPGIRFFQHETEKGFFEVSWKIMIPTFKKKGQGSNSTRGGGATMAEPRIGLNSLAETSMWETHVEWSDEERRLARRLISFVSPTIQGRDLGNRFGQSTQCYDWILNVSNEMDASAMVVDDKIDLQLVTPEPVRYSPIMQYVRREIADKQCYEYEHVLREKQSSRHLGQTRLDVYQREVSALRIAENANNGSRKDARVTADAGGVKQPKPVTKLRAIGTTIAIEFGEARFDASHTEGLGLRELHSKYKVGIISIDDLRDLRDDAVKKQQVWSNAVVGVADSDYEHGYDQMMRGEKQWTIGDVNAAIKSNYKGMNENMAFHTVLADDAMIAYTAYMEALLSIPDEGDACDFDFTEEEIIGKLYKDTDRLLPKFGSRTREAFPDIDDLEKYQHEKRLMRAVTHEVEDRMRLYETAPENPRALRWDDPRVEPVIRHIAAARRNQGPTNMGILLDAEKMSFGARPVPVIDRILKAKGLENAPKPETGRDLAQ